jgi:hypothetical protein
VWLVVVGSIALVLALAFLLPNNPNLAAGFSTRDIVFIEAILFLSGIMSGLSGFGFSAVGAACLLLIKPVLEVPLLQSLSTGNQLLSVSQLREDMPKTVRGFWAGPGPVILGGLIGVPIGTWLLKNLPAKQLTLTFGTILVLYAIYSIFKPAGAKLKGFDGPGTGAFVGFLGGIVGAFTAFPGASVVVWTGLRDLPKSQNRGIVQPFILVTQVYALAYHAWQTPADFGPKFWTLLAVTIPVVLPGTFGGVMLYRRISDVNFKRVSFLLLGLSGAVLLLRAVPWARFF